MAAGGSIGSGRMRLYGIYCTSALSGSFRGEDVGGGRQNFSGVVPVRNQSRDNLKERREDRSVEACRLPYSAARPLRAVADKRIFLYGKGNRE